MAQVKMQSAVASAAINRALNRRFAVRFIVSSISSAAGLISFVLTGPVMCRVATIDPALEAFYLALVAGWFWSLGRMWSLTLWARNQR